MLTRGLGDRQLVLVVAFLRVDALELKCVVGKAMRRRCPSESGSGRRPPPRRSGIRNPCRTNDRLGRWIFRVCQRLARVKNSSRRDFKMSKTTKRSGLLDVNHDPVRGEAPIVVDHPGRGVSKSCEAEEVDLLGPDFPVGSGVAQKIENFLAGDGVADAVAVLPRPSVR